VIAVIGAGRDADEATGELVNYAPPSFEGYWDNDEANAERMRDGAYWSGDLAYRDDAGFFYFAGRSVDWMQTYIFPGVCIPSLAAILSSLPGSSLSLTGADDIGPHYAQTLRAWREAFEARLPAVHALGYDEPFIRTWRLYLAFSEAAFAERTLGDHQLVFTRA